MPVPISNLTATWTSSANTYTGIGMNVTSTFYNANSTLLNLKLNNDSKFSVDPQGNTNILGNVIIKTDATINGNLKVSDTANINAIILKSSNTNYAYINSANIINVDIKSVNVITANITTANITTILTSSINSSSNLSFYINNIEKLRFNSNGTAIFGNVSTNPAVSSDIMLDIRDSSTVSNFRVGGSGENGTIRIGGGPGDRVAISVNDGIEAARFDLNGNLLIGRTDSVRGNGVKLDVAGSVNASSILLTAQPVWQGSFTARVGANTNYTPNGVVSFTRSIPTYYTADNTAIVIPVAGVYKVHAHQLITAAAVATYLHVRKNGVTLAYAYSPASAATRDMHVDTLVDCVSGDIIDFYYAGTTTTTWANPHSSVYVYLLG